MAYPIYNIRKKITLPDFWDFASLPDENTPNLKELEYHDFPYSTQLCVPGCFDAAPDFAGKRGIGVYRTLIQVSTAKRLFLKLPGVFLSAKIFFDGKEAGLADLPYSGMTFEFSSEKNGTHELVIAVDNRADFSVCPLYSNYYDFYPFGGIIRKPEMYELPETCFDRCRVTTLQLNPPKVRLEFNLTGKSVKEFRGAVQFDDGNASPLVLESAGYNTFRTDFELDNFGLWSPEHPELHTVTLTTADDSITERFGIRMIGTENGRILLNGVPQILLGYNRHESHPEFGSAVPAQIMLEDLQILKRLNCNFVRGCHYSQNPDFLDLCDSMGIFVWEEALGWGDGEDHLTNPFFCEKQIEQTKLMLKNSMNHPSVILWGFLNENHSHLTCARNLIQKLVSLIRQTDPSRLVTYASCMAEQDICYDLVDVVSTNLYPGWYGNNCDEQHPLAKIHPRLTELQNFFSKEEFKNKPWIISEIGAAALTGCHDIMKGPWSEDYQSEYIHTVCEFLRTNCRASGLALWQFMDCRSYKCSPTLNRARGFNNKGTFDEYRRPKMAQSVVQKDFMTIREERAYR